jgi:hypothetical protein
LGQVFESAEAQGCELDLDMGAVEDASLLHEVAQIRVEARAAAGADGSGGEAKRAFYATPAKLSKLKVWAWELRPTCTPYYCTITPPSLSLYVHIVPKSQPLE